MSKSEDKKVFLSYSHDSDEHKQKVRALADKLITDYEIEVIADCYEEDNPAGGLLTDFMQSSRQADRIICVLTPNYKLKADEGKGGVGYESIIITDEIYRDIASNRIIPIVLDSELSIKECFPNFLTSIRKTILRKDFDTEDLFIEEVARVIHKIPKKPKPALGKNKLSVERNMIHPVENINITELVSDHKCLFENALFYAKKGDEISFQKLFCKVKKQVFKNIESCRTKHEADFLVQNENDLPPIMDDFVNAAAPLFLIAFAGYLSTNEKFSNQEGLLIDLLSIDGWWQKEGRHYNIIQKIPNLLAYVYHHLYGALNINNYRIEKVASIFRQKIPVKQPSIEYKYLYEVSSVTAHIDSLGRNCFNSFNYLLTAYQRWDWISLLFQDKQEFKKALVSYQMAINLLCYLHMIKNKTLPLNEDTMIGSSMIPPNFSISDSVTLQYCYHFMIKNSSFFKNYISKIGLTEKEAVDQWNNYLNIIARYFKSGLYHHQLYNMDFMFNLLK